MQHRDKAILTVTCFGHFVSHFNMLVFPAILLPLASRLGMAMENVLGLSFFMYLLFGITALPWGIIADRIGPRTLLPFFFGGSAASGLFAAMHLDDPLLFAVGLSGIGFFSGIYHPAGLGWIAREIHATSRAMAYNGIFGNLGLAVAPLMAGVVNHYFGVRAVFFVLALVNVLGLPLFLGAGNGCKNVAGVSTAGAMERQSQWRPFIILLVAMMLGGIVYRGTSVTLPAYLQLNSSALYMQLQGLSGGFGSANLAATMITSMIYLIGMIGQYAGGKVGEKYDLRLGYLLFHAITVPAAIGVALNTDWALVSFATVHSFFLLGMQPIENTLVARYTPQNLLSSAFGMKFILTFGVGALSVKLIEQLRVIWSLAAVFIVLAMVSCGLCLVVMVLIKVTASATGTRLTEKGSSA